MNYFCAVRRYITFYPGFIRREFVEWRQEGDGGERCGITLRWSFNARRVKYV